MKLLFQVSTDEMPRHSHTYTFDTTKKGTQQEDGSWFVDAGTIGTKAGPGRSTDAAGKSVPHNTLPPSIASYGWRRTA